MTENNKKEWQRCSGGKLDGLRDEDYWTWLTLQGPVPYSEPLVLDATRGKDVSLNYPRGLSISSTCAGAAVVAGREW